MNKIVVAFMLLLGFLSFESNAQNRANFELLISALQDKDSNTLIYTVQIGAFKESLKDGHFNDLKNLFSSYYEDGLTRFYTGLFKSLSEAVEYRDQIRQKGYASAFVLGLDGGFDRTFIEVD